jgi:hypothetical protein
VDTLSPHLLSWTRSAKAFIANIEVVVKQNRVPLLSFAKGQRKDIAAGRGRS